MIYGGLKFRVLEALRNARRPLQAFDLAEIVYRDDPDGGPEAADRVVTKTIFDLRHSYGYGGRIRVVSTEHGRGYVLDHVPTITLTEADLNRQLDEARRRGIAEGVKLASQVPVDERVNAVRTGVASGLTYALIAERLGISRGAVAGIAYRDRRTVERAAA